VKYKLLMISYTALYDLVGSMAVIVNNKWKIST